MPSMTTWYKIDKRTFQITPVTVLSESNLRIKLADGNTGHYVGIDSHNLHFCKTLSAARLYAINLLNSEAANLQRELNRVNTHLAQFVAVEEADGR